MESNYTIIRLKTIAKYSAFNINIKLLWFPDGNYLVKSEELGVAGAIVGLKAFDVDSAKLVNAINEGNTDNIITSSLSVVADAANVMAVIPAYKVPAIAVSTTATAAKMLYEDRGEISQLLDELKTKMSKVPNTANIDANDIVPDGMIKITDLITGDVKYEIVHEVVGDDSTISFESNKNTDQMVKSQSSVTS